MKIAHIHLASFSLNRLSRIWLLPLLVTALVGACSLSRPNPDQSSWLITPERTGAARTSSFNVSLKMGSFTANPPFDGKSLVYRISDNQYDKDFYNVYLVYPRDMVANATRKWLSDSKVFTLIEDQPTTFYPYYQLQGVIHEFYGDYRAEPTAVVSIQFYASTSFNGTNNGIFSTPQITKRVRLKDKSTQALITGQQEALAQVLQELEERLASDAANAPQWKSVLQNQNKK